LPLSISFARRSMRASTHSVVRQSDYEPGSKLPQMPVFPHPARTAHLLPMSWHVVPIARAIRLASLPQRPDTPTGERPEELKAVGGNSVRCSRNVPTRKPTATRPEFGRMHPRLHRALRAVPGQTEHETDHGLFSGSEAHSRQNSSATLCAHLVLKIRPLK
jgi:hypothetical protein